MHRRSRLSSSENLPQVTDDGRGNVRVGRRGHAAPGGSVVHLVDDVPRRRGRGRGLAEEVDPVNTGAEPVYDAVYDLLHLGVLTEGTGPVAERRVAAPVGARALEFGGSDYLASDDQ